MARSRRTRTGFAIAAVVLAAAVGVTVWQVATESECTPLEGQRRLLAAYRADPAYRLAPPDATPVGEESRFAACRGDLANVPREQRPPAFAVSTTLTYRIPRPSTPRELYAVFHQSAEAAGWSLVLYSEPDAPGGQVTFCKLVLGEVSELSLSPWQETDGTYRLGVRAFTPLDNPASPNQKPTACPSPTTMPAAAAG